ncbi:SDR family oxidoreductase [Microbacterium sp. NPDC077644]|uniref:SDR family oxidoreductase n=1 Tax=Microbacterium sp. NPDC077644 TaxID=3155055 RepID=UPI00344B2D93
MSETGPVAIVGGGSTGIGRAAGEALARRGHRVVLVGRRPDRLEQAADELRLAMGAEVGFVAHDLSEPDRADAFLEEVTTRFGAPDVLVLNAGGPPPARVGELTDTDWRSAFDLLLLGPVRILERALPGMAERGFGRVIVVTSTAVRHPQPGLAASVVLRSAMTAAAKLFSLEFAAGGVTVNCVAPGATATERRTEIIAARAASTGREFEDVSCEDSADVPVGRPAEPGEIAAAIAFLASPEAGYINGTVLTVDGGRTVTI